MAAPIKLFGVYSVVVHIHNGMDVLEAMCGSNLKFCVETWIVIHNFITELETRS